MDKISSEDSLVLENLNLRAQVLELQRHLHSMQMAQRYGFKDGDQLAPDGTIVRKVEEKAEEKE